METIEVEKKDSVTTIYLNRPDVRNAFNAALITELISVFTELPHDRDTRVVVLAGRGKVFSAGADLKWMQSMAKATEEDNYQDSRQLAELFASINQCPQATIARVQGAALGGGLGLAAVCDIAVAADDASFGFTEVKLGLIPAVLSSFVIPKMGTSWARRYFVTGERFSAIEAMEIGLVHEIVPADSLDATIDALIQELMSAGPQAVTEAKELIARVAPHPSGNLLKETSQAIARVRISEEGQEGMAAFLEKRKPKWIPK